MSTSLVLVALLVSGPPPIGCGLVVDGNNRLGQGTVESRGFRGTALGTTGYSLTWKGGVVRTWTLHRPNLDSLTWRPKNGATATFTCTQASGERPTADRPSIGVMCLIDEAGLIAGVGSATHTVSGVRFSAQTTATELRMSITGDAIGFVAAWSEEKTSFGNARTLEVSGHLFTCWRL